MKTLAVAICCLIMGAAVAGSTGHRQDPNRGVPEKAALRPNPLAGRTEAVGGGRKLFRRHCAECHGADGSGLEKAANLRLQVVQAESDGALFWRITNGNIDRGMPSFSRLPALQRWQIVLYLRTFEAGSVP